ncbi:hypothetical protein AB5I41_03760 [Sphingomonas sp. MMS24-JH45]
MSPVAARRKSARAVADRCRPDPLGLDHLHLVHQIGPQQRGVVTFFGILGDAGAGHPPHPPPLRRRDQGGRGAGADRRIPARGRGERPDRRPEHHRPGRPYGALAHLEPARLCLRDQGSARRCARRRRARCARCSRRRR